MSSSDSDLGSFDDMPPTPRSRRSDRSEGLLPSTNVATTLYDNSEEMDWEEINEELARIPESFRVKKFDALPHIVEVLNMENPEAGLEQLRMQHKRLIRLIEKVVDVYYSEFNTAIRNYAKVLDLFNDNDKRISRIGKCLNESRQQLSTRSLLLRQQWRRGVILREVMRLMDSIEIAALSVDRVSVLIEHKMYLSAAILLKNAQRIICMPGVEGVGALRHLRIVMSEYKSSLKGRLLEGILRSIFGSDNHVLKSKGHDVSRLAHTAPMKLTTESSSVLREAMAAARDVAKDIDITLFENINAVAGSKNSSMDSRRMIAVLGVLDLLELAKIHTMKEAQMRFNTFFTESVNKWARNFDEITSVSSTKAEGINLFSDTQLPPVIDTFLDETLSECQAIVGRAATAFELIDLRLQSSDRDMDVVENDTDMPAHECVNLFWKGCQLECIELFKVMLQTNSHISYDTDSWLEGEDEGDSLNKYIPTNIARLIRSATSRAEEKWDAPLDENITFSFRGSAYGKSRGLSLEGSASGLYNDAYDVLPRLGLSATPYLYEAIDEFIKRCEKCISLPQESLFKDVKEWLDGEVLQTFLPHIGRQAISVMKTAAEAGDMSLSIRKDQGWEMEGNQARKLDHLPCFKLVLELKGMVSTLYNWMNLMPSHCDFYTSITDNSIQIVYDRLHGLFNEITSGHLSAELAQTEIAVKHFTSMREYNHLDVWVTHSLANQSEDKTNSTFTDMLRKERRQSKAQKANVFDAHTIVRLVHIATSCLCLLRQLGMFTGESKSVRVRNFDSSMSKEASPGPSTWEVFSFHGMDEQMNRFRVLMKDCIRTACIDLHLRLIFHVQHLPNYVSTERSEFDGEGFWYGLVSSLSLIDSQVQSAGHDIHTLILGSLPSIANQEIIAILPELEKIDRIGVSRLQGICTSLQQAVSGWTNYDLRAGDFLAPFEHARQYFELLTTPVDALLSFAAEEPELFTLEEYYNLLVVDVANRDVTPEHKKQLMDLLQEAQGHNFKKPHRPRGRDSFRLLSSGFKV